MTSRLVLLIAFALTFSLGACGNTFDGAGKDIEKSGEWIQDRF